MTGYSREILTSMSAAEGAAAATGLISLLRCLFDRGQIDERTVATIRDDMLSGIDPSVTDGSDEGMFIAYTNICVGFQFLTFPLPDLLEPGSDSGKRMAEIINGLDQPPR
jgi:hypothetical protein